MRTQNAEGTALGHTRGPAAVLTQAHSQWEPQGHKGRQAGVAVKGHGQTGPGFQGSPPKEVHLS